MERGLTTAMGPQAETRVSTGGGSASVALQEGALSAAGWGDAGTTGGSMAGRASDPDLEWPTQVEGRSARGGAQSPGAAAAGGAAGDAAVSACARICSGAGCEGRNGTGRAAEQGRSAAAGQDTVRGAAAGGAATREGTGEQGRGNTDGGARSDGWPVERRGERGGDDALWLAAGEAPAAAVPLSREGESVVSRCAESEVPASGEPAASEAGARVARADPAADAAARRAEDAASREALLSEALREVRATLSRLREEVGEALPGVETLVPLDLIVDEAALAALTPKLMPFFIEVTKRQVCLTCQDPCRELLPTPPHA